MSGENYEEVDVRQCMLCSLGWRVSSWDMVAGDFVFTSLSRLLVECFVIIFYFGYFCAAGFSYSIACMRRK